MRLVLVHLGLLFFLSGCSLFPEKQNTTGLAYKWGEDLPPQTLYLKAYRADVKNQQYQSEENYIAWIRRFFYGTVIQPEGWLEMSEKLVSQSPVDEQHKIDEMISALGVKISQEWAKDNKARKLDTKNMIVWGTALRESIESDDTVRLLSLVNKDVDALLAGTIKKRDIVDDRYYALEFDEFF